MSKTNQKSNDIQNTANSGATAGKIVEVLYQKMGSRWYSFTVINDEVYIGSIPDDAINTMREKATKNERPKEV